jgi:hypothetical protein
MVRIDDTAKVSIIFFFALESHLCSNPHNQAGFLLLIGGSAGDRKN